jgi:heme exporter protein C
VTTEQPLTSPPGAGPDAGRAPDGGPRGTGSPGTRVLGLVALAGVVVLAVLGLVATDPDVELGDTVRLLYVHVGVVVTGYLGIVVTTVGSIAFLWKRSTWWDLVAASAAEISALFIGLTLVSGMLWGKPTWGTYWEWDARLTSTLVLFLLLLGYLAVRRTAVDPVSRGRRSAIIGLLLLPNVVIVSRSVEWWRSLHQDATLFRIDPQIQNLQMFTQTFGMAVGAVIGLWLLIHRFRLAWLQDQVDRELLEGALVERRSEAGGSGS